MIIHTDTWEGLPYERKINHGYRVNVIYYCTDVYKDTVGSSEWASCPCCNLQPKIWKFDNGMQTGCGCGNNDYDHFSVMAESIMSYLSRNDGSLIGFDGDLLRKNWNEYCATMINPCSHGDLRFLGRW